MTPKEDVVHASRSRCFLRRLLVLLARPLEGCHGLVPALACALTEILARFVAGGRRKQQCDGSAGNGARDEGNEQRPWRSGLVSHLQKRLTRTFRYFRGSARMSRTRFRSSLTASFMFSYNCRSRSN